MVKTVTSAPAPQENITFAPTTTTIAPMMMITETSPYDAYVNLNFKPPNIQTNGANYIFIEGNTITPVNGWSFTSNTSTAPTASFLIGNGTSAKFKFTGIQEISPSVTQYGIVDYSSDSFNGTYSLVATYYFLNLTSVGDYVLTYYIQARKTYYTEKHTIQASINNYSTENYSFGSDPTNWGVWKKQELTFTINEVGTYPLTFTSSLNNVSGLAISSIAFGAITIQPLDNTTTMTPEL